MHDETEMDRMLGIEGIELIGINNRDLGNTISFQFMYLINYRLLSEGHRLSTIKVVSLLSYSTSAFAGTFKVDIGNTKMLLDRRRLDILNDKNIIVSRHCDPLLLVFTQFLVLCLCF